MQLKAERIARLFYSTAISLIPNDSMIVSSLAWFISDVRGWAIDEIQCASVRINGICVSKAEAAWRLEMHPFIKILSFILVLLLIGMANHRMLFFMMIFFLMLVIVMQVQAFYHALRRMRWLFLSILIIYAFSTPGELIPNFPVNFAPSFEGLQSGWVQIEKLLIALAALSLLLTRSPKEQMMLGLYMLLSPLRFLGLNIERFTARLMLTLDYVEELAASDKRSFDFSQLSQIDEFTQSVTECSAVSFKKMPFGLIDKFLLILFLVLFVLMVYQGLG